jgi:hypothetical protein
VGKFVRTIVSSGKDKEKRVVGKLTQTEFPPNPTDNNLRQVDPITALHHTTSRQPHAHARTTPTCPKGFDTFVFNMLICNFQVPPKPNILIYNYMTTRRNKKNQLLHMLKEPETCAAYDPRMCKRKANELEQG